MIDVLSIQPTIKTLIVKHPATGEPVGLEIDFRSMDSPEVRAVERQIKNKSLRSGRNSVSVEKIESAEYDLLAAAITAWRWSGGLTLAGDASPALNRVNIQRLFDSAAWIKKQLDDELQDESSFFGSARTVSLPSSSGESAI